MCEIRLSMQEFNSILVTVKLHGKNKDIKVWNSGNSQIFSIYWPLFKKTFIVTHSLGGGEFFIEKHTCTRKNAGAKINEKFANLQNEEIALKKAQQVFIAQFLNFQPKVKHGENGDVCR